MSRTHDIFQEAQRDGHQTDLVETLADIAKRQDLSEIEYEMGDLKIRVARQMTTMVQMPMAVAERHGLPSSRQPRWSPNIPAP